MPPLSPKNSNTASLEVAHLLRGLNPAQSEGVTSEASPLRILAGAGSGKTRVLTHRIAYRATRDTLDPNRVLAVTFTRKAASELRERLARLGLRSGVNSGTFHSIAYTQLRQRWEERNVRPPELLDRKVGFVSRLMSSKDRSVVLDVVSEIEWAAARMVTPDSYEKAATAARRRPPLPLGTVAGIYEKFMHEKRRRRLVDFDDLLRLAVRDLASDPVYASARQWRFRHLFVDEFQDVNPLQYHLLRAWLGPESDLCAVGDPNQAIYAWNGADARYLTDFDRYFPGGSSVTLEENYRSTPQVLTVANAVLDAGRSSPIRLKANRPDGAVPTVDQHVDASREAQAIARRVRDHHGPGTGWNEQAILVRTNAQTAVLVEVFNQNKIPHRVRGAGDILSQPEIKSALADFRRAQSLQMALGDLEDAVRRLAPDTLSSQNSDDKPGQDTSTSSTSESGRDGEPAPNEESGSSERASRSGANGLTDERAANLIELVRLGREYMVLDPTGGIPGFLAWLTSTLRNEDRAGGDAVEILTFHAAKGLEWPVVHLAGLEEGYVPIHHSKDSPEALEEERRLLYVALTRARDQLHCTWAAKRTFGSRELNRKPSPWLDIVASTVGVASPVVSGQAGVRRSKAARNRIKATNSGAGTRSNKDQALFELLRRWRKSQADAADVPAFVIFSDATLNAIVDSRPTSRAELLDIAGIGPVKVERYADQLLQIVGGT